MKIILRLITNVVLDDEWDEIEFEEFKLNWSHQVPHWHYLNEAGIKFFKGIK